MHRTGIFRSSVLVDVVNYLGVPLLVMYCGSMFVFPWIDGNGSWAHVQSVWDRWQSLNAAALAFVASLVAFNISRFNENLQRERDFVAAKAFLPSTLSSLIEFFSRSADMYTGLWNTDGNVQQPLSHPDLPSDYREVFSNCIRHADPEVGSYLSTILVQLQVHDARMRDVISNSLHDHVHVIDKPTLIAYLYRLGELYALVANLFDFARGEESFRTENLDWGNFKNAFANLDVEYQDIFINEKMNLQAFTERTLKRAEEQHSAGKK